MWLGRAEACVGESAISTSARGVQKRHAPVHYPLQTDYITEKVYQIANQTGISNLSISKSMENMIVRYQDRYYEFRADARIQKLRSHLEYDTVAIFIGTQTRFYQLSFNFIKLQLHRIYDAAVQVTQIQMTFYPSIIIHYVDQDG